MATEITMANGDGFIVELTIDEIHERLQNQDGPFVKLTDGKGEGGLVRPDDIKTIKTWEPPFVG